MSLRLFVPRVRRTVAVVTVGHACGFMLIAEHPPPRLTVPEQST